jgi:hypothetical protein
MYMSDETELPTTSPFSTMAMTGLAIAVIGVIYLGILPSSILTLAQNSVRTIF